MRLSNVTDIQKFLKAVNACKHEVYLKSQEGDIFNLKSSLSQYIAIGRLLEESGEALELYAQSPDDEVLLHRMLGDLDP